MLRSISSSAVAFILLVLDVSPTQVIPSPSQPGEQRAHGAHYWQLDEGKGQQASGDALPSPPVPSLLLGGTHNYPPTRLLGHCTAQLECFLWAPADACCMYCMYCMCNRHAEAPCRCLSLCLMPCREERPPAVRGMLLAASFLLSICWPFSMASFCLCLFVIAGAIKIDGVCVVEIFDFVDVDWLLFR